MHDTLVVHPLSEQQLDQQADDKRDRAIAQRQNLFDIAQVHPEHRNLQPATFIPTPNADRHRQHVQDAHLNENAA